MQNSMVVFTFSVFDRKYPSWVKLVKKKNCQFLVKFGNLAKLNMQNSMVIFTFSVLEWKEPFWPNLVHKIQIVSLS